MTKLRADGAALLYSTFLGGTAENHGWAIVIDGASRAHVTGFTQSDDFPTTAGAPNPSWAGGYDAFLALFDATAITLLYSTYLGGSGADFAYGVALDSGGGAYLTGTTFSTDFPTTAGAFDTTLDGVADAWLARLEPAGAGLTFSTSFGGTGDELASGMAVDAQDDAYVAGWTSSSDFPTTPEAFDASFNLSKDAFVARISDGDAHALTLTPTSAANTVGRQHCVLGVMRDATGNPLPGMVLRVSVQGPNSAAARTITRIDGAVIFCYTGTHAGIDTIVFYVDADDDGIRDFGELTRTVAKFYTVDAPDSLTVSPGTHINAIGDSHCVTAAVRDRFQNGIPEILVRFMVTGAAERSGAARSDAAGHASFCYTQVLVPGQDAIFVYADVDGDGTRDTDEPSASASKQWVLPPSSPGCGTVAGSIYMIINGASTQLTMAIGQSAGASPTGTLTYQTTLGIDFAATKILSLVILDDVAVIFGEGSLNGGERVPFVVGLGTGPSSSSPVAFRIMWPGYGAEDVSLQGEMVIATCE